MSRAHLVVANFECVTEVNGLKGLGWGRRGGGVNMSVMNVEGCNGGM